MKYREEIKTKDGKIITPRQLDVLYYREISETQIKTMTYKECSDIIGDVLREWEEMNGKENHYINHDEFDVD